LKALIKETPAQTREGSQEKVLHRNSRASVLFNRGRRSLRMPGNV
jgi:hypothetical protein